MTNRNMYDDAIVSLPKLTRLFPKSIEFLLPLRHSFVRYKEDGGRVLVSAESPETNMHDSEGANMFTMCCQVSVVGHGSVVNGNMCISDYPVVHTSPVRVSYLLEQIYSTPLKWTVGLKAESVVPFVPTTMQMQTCANCYSTRSPLSVYTNLAVLECADHFPDSTFWRALYQPLEPVDKHYGLYGLLYDNTVLSIGSKAGDDNSADIEARSPSPFTRGFLDVCFTPQSKSAGRVRTLCAGVSIRIMTSKTIEMVKTIMSQICSGSGIGFGDWLVRCFGFTCSVTVDDVHKMVNKWKTMCEYDMPTLHVFESQKVITVSASSGVLTRPVRTIAFGGSFMKEGPFVDSMCVYHSDTLKFANINFPSFVYESEQYFNVASLTVPFAAWTTEPRLNIGVQMLVQSMNLSPIQGDATMVSMGTQTPLVMTSFTDSILSAQTSECQITMPDKSMIVAFVNTTSNTEDACVVAEEVADSGLFSWYGYINYPVPSDCGHVRPGTKLLNQDWWKPSLEGVVVSMFMSKTGYQYAVVVVGSKRLEVGDKLATAHGLKFTVGQKMSQKDMPVLVDTNSGEQFKPSMLISTKNVTRGLGGQCRQMSASMSLFKSVRSFRSLDTPQGRRVFSPRDEREVPPLLPTAYVTMNGSVLQFLEKNGTKRQVKCNYGIMSTLQLRHISALKQHYPSTVTESILVPRGRYRRGTPRLGETELVSMMMQGLNSCVRDAVVSSDLCYVSICSVCKTLPIFCACPDEKPNTTTVKLRYSAVMMNVFSTVAMLNDPDQDVLTLRFDTST